MPFVSQPNNDLIVNTAAIDNRYPSSLRLRKRSEFTNLKDSDQKNASRYFLVVWKENNVGHVRLGITVSKRVGCSVIRNTIKRFVREVFRNSHTILPAVDINVIARSAAAGMDFHTLQQQLLNAFRHIGVSTCSKVSHS